MTVDLGALPRRRARTRSSSGCAARGASSPSATRTPTPTRSAPTLGDRPHRRGARRRAPRRSAPTRAAAVRLPAGRRAVPDRPGARRDYDLLVVSRLRHARPGRRGRRPARATCSSDCRASSSTTTSRTTAAARPTGSTRRRRDVRDGRAARGPARASRSTPDDGALATALMAGIVMDTATFAHPNATPRTLAVVGGAGRGRRAAVGHLAPALPHEARRPAAAVRAGARPARDVADGGRVVWSTLLDADLAATGAQPRPLRGDHRPARAGRGRRGRDPVQGGRAAATRISVRTKPGGVDATVLTGAFGGGGHARAAGATVQLPLDAGRPPCSPRPSGSPPRSAADRGAQVPRPRAGRRPGRRQAGRPDLARRRRASSGGWRRRAGWATAARSTRSRRACCRSSSAARRASSSTTSADGSGYRATVCFGATSTTDDLEGERTPATGRRRRATRWRRRCRR